MAGDIPQGSWVEIHRVVLPAGLRAPQAPEDTRCVDLEMRVKGFLLAAAKPGDEVEIRTRAGRNLTGTLSRVNPAYEHGFGPPVPELSTLGQEAWEMLRTGRRGG